MTILDYIKPTAGFGRRVAVILSALGVGYLVLLFLKYQLGFDPESVSGFMGILAVLFYVAAFIISPKSLVVNFIDFVRHGSGSSDAQHKLMVVGFTFLVLCLFIKGVAWALPGIF